MNNLINTGRNTWAKLLSNWRFRTRVLITLSCFLVLSVGTLTYLSSKEYREASDIEDSIYETIFNY